MKERAPRNKTLTLTEEERKSLQSRLLSAQQVKGNTNLINKTIHGDALLLLSQLPAQIADLIIVDPPYNLSKNFNGFQFKATTESQYLDYLRSWFPQLCKLLKPNGSLYLCGDWKSTSALQQAMEENLTVMNRITWQREKGRGASKNWKNGMEDIWYGVVDKKNYYFDLESVKQKRRVLAPYREKGVPKDWEESDEGKFRLTCPSNFWDDITVPYWSMPENTDHPTQKPEKLIAKLILASCPPDGLVFDPFLGSGTTSVVAKKLGRQYLGVEMNEEYCLWAEKRLMLADENPRIQGYENGVFKERNMH